MSESSATTAVTATRVEPNPAGATRTLYRLSDSITRKDALLGDEMTFDHIVVSLGREGDTCAFPADSSGRILDFFGFGFAFGISRWLTTNWTCMSGKQSRSTTKIPTTSAVTWGR